MKLSRREFIHDLVAAVGACSVLQNTGCTEKIGEMPYRLLGKTNLNVSLLSLGGHTIAEDEVSEKNAIRIMRTAIDQGINFFDNVWDYHDGRSEEWMGKALLDGYREKVVLMTKHHGREPQRARQHLEDSLRRLKTDVIDVWQFHEIDEIGEVVQIYESGVLDFVQKARDEGKVRFIGFTGHYRPELHLEMINRGFNWDTVQMPINILDNHFRSFTKNVLPLAVEKKLGVIAMKTLAGPPGVIVKGGIATAQECHRFAMTMPISTLCSGIDSLEILSKNLKTVRSFRPMTEDEMVALLEKSMPFAESGEYEEYKTYEPESDDDW